MRGEDGGIGEDEVEEGREGIFEEVGGFSEVPLSLLNEGDVVPGEVVFGLIADEVGGFSFVEAVGDIVFFGESAALGIFDVVVGDEEGVVFFTVESILSFTSLVLSFSVFSILSVFSVASLFSGFSVFMTDWGDETSGSVGASYMIEK